MRVLAISPRSPCNLLHTVSRIPHRRLVSSSGKAAPPPPPPPQSGAAKLTNRRLISIVGQDTPKFLQGIITNNVSADTTAGFYTAFLTAQGKVLHDAFVYPTRGSRWHRDQTASIAGADDQAPGFLVEVDAQQVDVLMKHLKRHKLRSKFQLRVVEDGEVDVWSTWQAGHPWTAHGPAQTHLQGGVIGLTDCRAPGMGQRLILRDDDEKIRALEGIEEMNLEAYTLRRYLRGVPEGQEEMPRDDCLPMNCNLDIMGGIDFKKGCYVGQELTIRTHHTGVVRRRILPVMMYERAGNVPESLEYNPASELDARKLTGTDIRRDDKRKRSTGKLIAGLGNIGLGMCRLEQMTDLKVSSEPSSFTPDDRFILQTAEDSELGIKAFVPDWIRGSIREPKIQKRVG